MAPPRALLALSIPETHTNVRPKEVNIRLISAPAAPCASAKAEQAPASRAQTARSEAAASSRPVVTSSAEVGTSNRPGSARREAQPPLRERPAAQPASAAAAAAASAPAAAAPAPVSLAAALALGSHHAHVEWSLPPLPSAVAAAAPPRVRPRGTASAVAFRCSDTDAESSILPALAAAQKAMGEAPPTPHPARRPRSEAGSMEPASPQPAGWAGCFGRGGAAGGGSHRGAPTPVTASSSAAGSNSAASSARHAAASSALPPFGSSSSAVAAAAANPASASRRRATAPPPAFNPAAAATGSASAPPSRACSPDPSRLSAALPQIHLNLRGESSIREEGAAPGAAAASEQPESWHTPPREQRVSSGWRTGGASPTRQEQLLQQGAPAPPVLPRPAGEAQQRGSGESFRLTAVMAAAGEVCCAGGAQQPQLTRRRRLVCSAALDNAAACPQQQHPLPPRGPAPHKAATAALSIPPLASLWSRWWGGAAALLPAAPASVLKPAHQHQQLQQVSAVGVDDELQPRTWRHVAFAGSGGSGRSSTCAAAAGAAAGGRPARISSSSRKARGA